jgi:hypothetical protein
MMIPLQLFLLARPGSRSSGHPAEALLARFEDPPATGGLRVQDRLTPEISGEENPELFSIAYPPMIAEPARTLLFRLRGGPAGNGGSAA